MGRRPLLVLSLLACLFAALPAVANAARAKTSSPTVKSVSPKKVRIGQNLTVKGRYFIRGKRRNSVVFSNSKRAAVFVRVERSGSSSFRVKLPDKLNKLLTVKNGVQVGTRLRLRIISRRAGKSLSPTRISPIVYPASGAGRTGGGGTTGTGTGTGAPGGCAAGSDDGDLLPYDVEVAIGTQPCSKDSDGDSMEDGWEYQSALDLNDGATSLPYPGKRPYPNALDSSDGGNEYDGDGMEAWEEHAMWRKACSHSIPLCYSAGKKYSDGGATTPANGGPLAHLDFGDDDAPLLSDDERDADGDGLSNWVETSGPLSDEAYWTANYPNEMLYHWGPYVGTDFLDTDSDGDSLADGADDQDYDGFNNILEAKRVRGNGLTPSYLVQPFNPCTPDPTAEHCSPYFKPGIDPHTPFKACYVEGVTVVPIRVDDVTGAWQCV